MFINKLYKTVKFRISCYETKINVFNVKEYMK